MNKLKAEVTQNKKWLYFALIATFVWGLMAHGYGFMQSSFSHDSLNEFNGAAWGNNLKIMTGRFLSPVYRAMFRTDLTLPWLIGVLALLWIGLTVFLVLRIFRIESKVTAFLVAGIFTANLTVSTTAATFMHDFDCDMLSLLFSVAAVYLWQNTRWGGWSGALLVALSLALYQSYITVTIVLVMFVCILDLLNEASFKHVFVKGLKAVGMLLLGGILYYAAMKTALHVTDTSMLTGQYNTLDRPLEMTTWSRWLFQYIIRQTYTTWYTRLVNVLSPYPAITAGGTKLLLVLIVVIAVAGLLNGRVRLPEKLLCIGLLGLLPFAMNLMHFLTIENAHELMLYAFWLTYLLALLLADWLAKWLKRKEFKFGAKGKAGILKLPKCVCAVLVLALVYGNVQTANAMYLKKDLEQDAYLSLMTRVVYKMEDCDGYLPGTTPVVLVGLPEQLTETIPGFERYRDPNGMYKSDVLNFPSRERWQAYFDYILSNPAVLAEETVWDTIVEDPLVTEMPSYPSDRCIAMLDDVLVVKLGE